MVTIYSPGAAHSNNSGDINSFAAQKSPLTPESCSHGMDVETHNGTVSQFNLHFIHQGNTVFAKSDYQEIAKADRIRNASDYDNFYIVNKEETKELLEFVKDFLERTEEYISKIV